MPVMGRITADNNIKCVIGKWQAFDITLAGGDIFQLPGFGSFDATTDNVRSFPGAERFHWHSHQAGIFGARVW